MQERTCRTYGHYAHTGCSVTIRRNFDTSIFLENKIQIKIQGRCQSVSYQELKMNDNKILFCVYAFFTSTKLNAKFTYKKIFYVEHKKYGKVNFYRMTRNSEKPLSLSGMLRNNLWIRCRFFHTEAKHTTFSQDFAPLAVYYAETHTDQTDRIKVSHRCSPSYCTYSATLICGRHFQFW